MARGSGATGRGTAGRTGTVVMLHDVLPDGEPLSASGFTGPGPDRYKIRSSVFAEVARRAGASGTVLTFDDGGRSAIEVIAPILAEHGVRGEFFVATSRIGTPGFLTRRQVAELAGAGHVVGSHSHTHPEVMPALPYDRILDEWCTSAAILEDITGVAVQHASIPNGFASRGVVHAAAEAGFRTLFTSSPTMRRRSYAGMEVVGRYAVLAVDSPQRTAALAAGALLPRLQQSARWSALALPKQVLGEKYPDVRRRILGVMAGRAA